MAVRLWLSSAWSLKLKGTLPSKSLDVAGLATTQRQSSQSVRSYNTVVLKVPVSACLERNKS